MQLCLTCKWTHFPNYIEHIFLAFLTVRNIMVHTHTVFIFKQQNLGQDFDKKAIKSLLEGLGRISKRIGRLLIGRLTLIGNMSAFFLGYM